MWVWETQASSWRWWHVVRPSVLGHGVPIRVVTSILTLSLGLDLCSDAHSSSEVCELSADATKVREKAIGSIT